MDENKTKTDAGKSLRYGRGSVLLSLVLAFSALICVWTFLYRVNDATSDTPSDTQVSAPETEELVPDELPDYLEVSNSEETAVTTQETLPDEDHAVWTGIVTEEPEETTSEQTDATEPSQETTAETTAAATEPSSEPEVTETTAVTETTPAPSVNAPSDPTMLELFNLVNDARAEQGLSPLSWSSSLAADAAARAQEIAVVFSHTRPDGSEWWTVDPDRMYGENIAAGQTSAQDVFNSWWSSEGHKANMLGNYTTCGFALYCTDSGYYWVQEFGY